MPTIIDFINLWRVSRKRIISERDYLEFQAFQARLVIQHLNSKGVFFANRLTLDVGSGIGGYALEFVSQGATVISIDLTQPRRPTHGKLSPITGDALTLPFCNNCFEIVFCASLIEHVAQPELVLNEIARVLRPNGYAYISFPPYYSPMGGHEYAPFHYLGEKLAMRLVSRNHIVPTWVRELYPVNESPEAFNELYRGWGLYKMTIKKMQTLLASSSLTCIDLSTRYFPLSFVKWPMVSEFLTWHAQFLLTKKPAQ